MKKVLIIFFIIIIIGSLGFGVKILLDKYSEKEQKSSIQDYLDDGWEIEAEYNYSGNISENDLQEMEE